MSATKTDIWMPVYIGDYLADTMHLTTEQHGAYLLLLFHLWRRGTLPNNDIALAKVTGLDAAVWTAQRPVLEEFFTVSQTSWTHRRVEKERARIDVRTQANTKRAQKAAAGRWDASSIDKEMLEESKSQSHSQSDLELPFESPSSSQAAPEFDSEPAIPPPPIVKPLKTSAGVSSKRTADARHVPFRGALAEYWQNTNAASPEMPWQGRDAKALSEFLKASPQLDETEFRRLLRNRARSAVAHGDRVYLWIGNLTRYQEALNAYNKPVSQRGGLGSRAEINRDSVLHAVSRAIRLAGEGAGRAGNAGAESADFLKPRMPAGDGWGPAGRSVDVAGESDWWMAERDAAYGATGGDGPLPYCATATVTSGVAAFGG